MEALVCIFFIHETSSIHIAWMFQLVVCVTREYNGLLRYIKRKEDNAVNFDSIYTYNEEELRSGGRRQDLGYRCRHIEEEAGWKMS